MKKGNAFVAIIVTIVVMLLIVGGIGFAGVKLGVIKFDMGALNNFGQKEEEKKDEVDIYSKEYNVDDYVSVAKDDTSGVKLVTFKKNDSDDITKFTDKQIEFTKLKIDGGNKKTNVVRTNAEKGILSVYTKETVKKSDTIISESSYSINLSIESNEKIKNEDVFNIYNVKIDNVTKAVINKFAEESVDITYTDSTGSKVKAADIKNNSSKYAEILKSNIEDLVVYTKKDKVYIDVNPAKLLKMFGLETQDTSKIVNITSVAI